MSKVSEHVGSLIKQARKKNGLTQRELGERLGIGEPTVNKYESGKHNLTIETLQKIADALETELKISL